MRRARRNLQTTPINKLAFMRRLTEIWALFTAREIVVLANAWTGRVKRHPARAAWENGDAEYLWGTWYDDRKAI